MTETKNEDELRSLCLEISKQYQDEFNLIFNDNITEYDAFTKFINLSKRFEDELTIIVNKFNPKYYSQLEIKYFRLIQFSTALEFRTEFHKKNSLKLREKYIIEK